MWGKLLASRYVRHSLCILNVLLILTLHVLHYSRLLVLMSELPNGTIVYVPNNPTCQNSRHNKIKLRSFKSSERIHETKDGPYRAFDFSSLFSDPLDLATWSKREIL